MKNNKNIFWIVFYVVIFILLSLVAAGYLFLREDGYQQVNLKGYGLCVPEKWEIKTEDNTVSFHSLGVNKGQFSLLYKEYGLSEIPALFGYEVSEPLVRESDQYAAKVYEISFKDKGNDILQYVFDGLPSAPPYHLVLTLKDVNERLAIGMLSSVTLPEKMEFEPAKPIAEPSEDERSVMVYNVRDEQNYYTNNITELEKWLKAETRPEAGQGLHVLSYENGEEQEVLKKWHYLVHNGDKNYLYTYYRNDDGQYIYDNEPQVIKEFTKVFSEEENYSRYLADGTVIFEGPYNQYSERKETLLQYKETQVADTKKVEALVKEMMPKGVALEEIKIDVEEKPEELVVEFSLDEAEKFVQEGKLDESSFYQNTLVLMSLIDDVENVQINIKDKKGDKEFKAEYSRAEAEEKFENQDLREFAKDVEKFTQFTEDVPQVAPPGVDGAATKKDGTTVLKSITITIDPSMKFGDPETGELYSSGSIAKKYGVTQYMNKPITVTLNERVKKGKISYYAAARCEGKHIGSYPLDTPEEFDELAGKYGY